jgi:hypothetical protein
MASVFWDSERVIHVDYLPHGGTMNAQYYSTLLRSDVLQAVRNEKTWKTVKDIILLHGTLVQI